MKKKIWKTMKRYKLLAVYLTAVGVTILPVEMAIVLWLNNYICSNITDTAMCGALFIWSVAVVSIGGPLLAGAGANAIHRKLKKKEEE